MNVFKHGKSTLKHSSQLLFFRFYCELFFDKVIYAKTSSKTKSDILFWGENFAFK